MAEKIRLVLVDNQDSFTWNLVEEFASRGCDVEVWGNGASADGIAARAGASAPALLVLSPGPGAPGEAGCCMELIRRAEAGRIPTFGVCLGLQAMVAALGGRVGTAGTPVHGRASRVEHGGGPLFEGIPSPFAAARYHSLAAAELPPDLEATARSGDVVMAVSHRRAPMLGVQFHPESILTPEGGRMIANLLEWTRRVAR